MRKRSLWVTLVVATAVLPVALASAQSNVTTGKLQGTVVDPEGAPLAGATVEARRPDTGFVRRAVTDADGRYTIDLVPPGTFEIKADFAGLRTELKQDVSVKLGSVIQVDYEMRPAAFADELVVTAQSPVVETASSTVSASVSDTAIANLPLNGRDFSDLILLTPAAVTARAVDLFNQESRGTEGGVNIGARSVQNSFNIDGTTAQSSFYGDNRGSWFNITAFSFSQAAIQELQVIRSSYGLEFSAGGAVINAITKSGSNEIHGEVFGYYRDERFIGADAEENKAEDFRQMQYGFALGGPIKRDRLHWFVSYDQEDFEEPSLREFEGFPEERWRDWEELTGLNWEGETGWLTGVKDTRAVLLKLDWQLGSRHMLSARYNKLSVPDNHNLVAGWDTSGWSMEGQAANDYDSAVFSLNSVISPHLMNEAFVQYSVELGSADPNTISIPEVGVGPGFWWDGGFGQNRYLPVELSESRWQLVDNLSYSIGRHVIQGGINFDFVSFEEYWLQYNSGQYRFDSWEHFLDGPDPFSYIQAFATNDGWIRTDVNTYAAYLQDEWQAAPSLSLIYGLRYDYQQHEQPPTTNPRYPLTGQIPNDDDNVSARFGAAWDSTGDGKAVFRAGIGVFYDPTPTLFDAIVRSQNGIDSFLVTRYCEDGGCPTFPDRWDSIADLPPDSYPDVWVYDPQFENPQTLRMSIGYEGEIFKNFALGINLMYSRSRDLQTKQDQNMEPTDEQTVDGRTVYQRWTEFPYFNRVLHFRSDGRASAKSLLLTARKRFSDGWFLDASYTWSDIRDNGSNQRSAHRTRFFPEDQFDIDADWGPSDFDVRHKIVVSGGVYLPYQFMISGYVFARSGFPYSAFHEWPDLNGDGYRESERSVVETEDGDFFHFSRNTFRQPWFYTTNLRISKSFRLGLGTQIEIIGEVFNLFDRANRYTTRWTLSEGCFYWGEFWVSCETFDDFGELNQVGSPRQYQLGLRLRF
jgi:outer membrane receptor protein involved in Fe transport